MATTNNSQTSTTTGSTTSGGLNVGGDFASGILSEIFKNYGQQGGASGGVAEITPEMKAAINAMMNQQGGGGFLNGGQGMLDQASGSLSGNLNVGSGDIIGMAEGLMNKDLLANQLGQLTESATEGLTQGLNQISSGASMSGGLGSSRTALTQGKAIEGSQKALTNAQSNLINSTYQQVMEQAIGIEQANKQNQLTQGQLQGQLGLGQAGLGAQMNNDQVNAMLKAGIITQEQADKLQASGGNNINQMLGQLDALLGQSGTTNQTTTTTGQSSNKTDWGDLAGGVGSAVTGGILDWLLPSKK